MRRLPAGVGWLLFVWVALTGSASPANLLVGVLAAVALILLFPPASGGWSRLSFRPWRALSFAGFFAARFAAATVQVAVAVLVPERSRRNRAIIAVRICAPTEMTTTLLANAVSLTPGSCFIEMHRDPAIMYVHVLQVRSLTAQRLEILDLERRIVRAFGPLSDVEVIEALMARVRAEGEG
jgi:multicomponent Na+:H+ antiporter subunit E